MVGYNRSIREATLGELDLRRCGPKQLSRFRVGFESCATDGGEPEEACCAVIPYSVVRAVMVSKAVLYKINQIDLTFPRRSGYPEQAP